MQTKTFRKGDEIIKEDQIAQEFFVVQKGVVAINKNVAGGRKRNLANLSAGEIVGEISLFDSEPRSANVEAVEDSELGVFQINEFNNFMKENIEIANRIKNNIIETLCSRLRRTDDLINEGVIWGFKMTV